MHPNPHRWIIGITGASGLKYALRLIEVLPAYSDETHVVFSEAALRVLKEEENRSLSFSRLTSETLLGKSIPNLYFHNCKDIGASFASGSYPCSGMVIVPCSMRTLGLIAHGCGSNLIHRAADVMLKEKKPLIIVPRETPLSTIHLENMLKLSQMGVSMVPAMPGFYHQPAAISDLVDMMVMKILDQMGIRSDLVKRWRCEGPDEVELGSAH